MPTTESGRFISNFGTESQGVNWCSLVFQGRCLRWGHQDANGNRVDQPCPYSTNRSLGVSFALPVG